MKLTPAELKGRLTGLADEFDLVYHQQDVARDNQCLMGRNGRLWITSNQWGFDISLSGQSLIGEMTGFMEKLTGHPATGSKQTNFWVPFWRVSDWELVRAAAERYSMTRKP
jgi:hypothetical protein